MMIKNYYTKLLYKIFIKNDDKNFSNLLEMVYRLFSQFSSIRGNQDRMTRVRSAAFLSSYRYLQKYTFYCRFYSCCDCHVVLANIFN